MASEGEPRPANELGRVADPAALDASSGPCGRVRVVIPEGWAREGAAIEVVLPGRVECGVCRGGGCDRCNRSGAHRLPSDEAERRLELSLPPLEGDAVLLRVPRPFGGSGIELLNVEIAKGETASSSCRLLSANPALAPAAASPAEATLRWVWLAAAIAVLIVALLMARS